MENVELDIRDDALNEIAKKAISMKTGARAVSYTHLTLPTIYSV